MCRIHSLDLARGFTVLFIPAIHSMLLYSQPVVREMLLGSILQCIAEGPGAQLFLLLMGVNCVLSTHITFHAITKKAVALIISGYALNIAKFLLPLSVGRLPVAFLKDLQMANDDEAWLKLLLIGDIFQCAAICLIIIYFVKKCPYYQIVALFLAVVIIIVSPWVWRWYIDNSLLNYVWQLFNGQPPHIFFPTFPWLVYPLCGLTIGYYLKQNKKETFAYLGQMGIILIAVPCFYRLLFPVVESQSFYQTEAPETIYHVGMVLITLYVWYWLSNQVRENKFFTLLRYSSKRITALYVIQWILIMWLLPVVGYQQHPLAMTIILIIVITGLTYAICASITNK